MGGTEGLQMMMRAMTGMFIMGTELSLALQQWLALSAGKGLLASEILCVSIGLLLFSASKPGVWVSGGKPIDTFTPVPCTWAQSRVQLQAYSHKVGTNQFVDCERGTPHWFGASFNSGGTARPLPAHLIPQAVSQAMHSVLAGGVRRIPVIRPEGGDPWTGA